jgi:hypothetical protein
MTFRSVHDRVVVIRTNVVSRIADDNPTASINRTPNILLAHNPPDAPDCVSQLQINQ